MQYKRIADLSELQSGLVEGVAGVAGADDPPEVQAAVLLAQAVLGGAGVLRVGDAATRRQGVARAAGVAVAAHDHSYYRLSSQIHLLSNSLSTTVEVDSLCNYNGVLRAAATHQSTQCPAWWQRARVRTMSWLGQVTTSCLLAAPASPSPTSTSYTALPSLMRPQVVFNNPLPT